MLKLLYTVCLEYLAFLIKLQILIFTICAALLLGGQNCIDNPDVSQIGTDLVPSGRQVIVPNAKLYCTVRVTHIAASLGFGDLGSNQTVIQIWRPSSPNSSVYNRIAQVQATGETTIEFNHFFLNLSVSNNSDFEIQSGDVIGYYQPVVPRRRIWSIRTTGYTSYSNNAISPATTIDIDNVDNVELDIRPLIELSFGKYTLHRLNCLLHAVQPLLLLYCVMYILDYNIYSGTSNIQHVYGSYIHSLKQLAFLKCSLLTLSCC